MFDWLVLSQKKRKTEIETGLYLFCFVGLYTYSLQRKCPINILLFSESGITHVQIVENKTWRLKCLSILFKSGSFNEPGEDETCHSVVTCTLVFFFV